MTWRWVSGAIGVAAVLAVVPAQAAEIRVAKVASGPVVVVAGSFDYDDGARFTQLTASLPKSTTVVFNSPGGNLLAGLKIGEITRARGFSTMVADGSLCASACAIAWLGGTKRFLSSEGRLGFHAASGSYGVSAPGNALVGAYMAKLGLSQEAVYALTAASPNDIAWVDFAGARELGISVERYSGTPFGSTLLASNRTAPRPVPGTARPQSWPASGTRSAPQYYPEDDDGSSNGGHAAVRRGGAASGPSGGCTVNVYGGHGGCNN